VLRKISNKLRKLGPIGTSQWLYNGAKLRHAQKVRRRKLDFSGKSAGQRQIFIFAAVPFYDVGGGQRSAQLARTLTERSFAVHYIYAAPSAESKVHIMQIPTVTHRALSDYRLAEFASRLRPDDIALFELPRKEFLPYLLEANLTKAQIIYENIDNWEATLGKSFFDPKTTQKFIRMADLLIGTAQPLITQLISYGADSKKVIYAPNAVNHTLFDPHQKYPRPKDLIRGTKTLLYYGTLDGEWLDWALIWSIAKKLPKYSINLIGDQKNILGLTKAAPNNVHFLGPKPQTQLPTYLKHSDIAILPFLIDETARFVSPLKIFEYIAMQKPTISTQLPDIAGYPNVWVGNNSTAWIKLAKGKLPVDKTAAQKFIYQNTWASRATQIIQAIDDQASDP